MSKHRLETKFLQQVSDVDVWMNGDNNTTDQSSAFPGGYNRWVALGFHPTAPTSNRFLYSSAASGSGYNASAFALVVPQGVGAQERVGRDINVMRDEWFFRFSFPLALPQIDAESSLTSGAVYRNVPYWANAAAAQPVAFVAGNRILNTNIGQRPVRIRLVGLMQRVTDVPGDFGFGPGELFNNNNEITTRFNKNDARGYHIVYDKTKTFYPQPGYAVANGSPPSASPSRNSHQKYDVSFSCKMKPYLRRYEGNNTPDNTTGDEIVLDGGGNLVGGISMGAISWYMYVEDKFASMMEVAGSASASGAAFYVYTPGFMKMEVNRKTLWTDP